MTNLCIFWETYWGTYNKVVRKYHGQVKKIKINITVGAGETGQNSLTEWSRVSVGDQNQCQTALLFHYC